MAEVRRQAASGPPVVNVEDRSGGSVLQRIGAAFGGRHVRRSSAQRAFGPIGAGSLMPIDVAQAGVVERALGSLVAA